MKRLFPIITISLPAIVLLSCSKEKSENPANGNTSNPTISKIKTWSNSASQRTYIYNNGGKLTEVQSNTGSKETFEYPAGKIIKKQFNTAGVNDFTAEYELDANGLGITEKRTAQPGFTGTLIYNDQKQPVKFIYNMNGLIQTQDYFYSNGNCDSVRYSENGNWKYTRIFTYYANKFNYLSNEAYGYPFFGKESKNLVKTDQFVNPDGSSSELVTITYEFDAQGRPVKETRSQGINIYINFISYY